LTHSALASFPHSALSSQSLSSHFTHSFTRSFTHSLNSHSVTDSALTHFSFHPALSQSVRSLLSSHLLSFHLTHSGLTHPALTSFTLSPRFTQLSPHSLSRIITQLSPHSLTQLSLTHFAFTSLTDLSLTQFSHHVPGCRASAILVYLGPSRGHLGAVLGDLVAISGHLGAILGHILLGYSRAASANKTRSYLQYLYVSRSSMGSEINTFNNFWSSSCPGNPRF
jgi:hypothetical protein